jgi:Peptidase propeptide and YPEB domain
MIGLLALGFVLVHVVDRNGAKVSQDEAVAIARAQIDFKPEDYQIRFIRRGIPSRGYWVVSFFIRKQAGGYERVTVVLVDAASGRVTEVRRTT